MLHTHNKENSATELNSIIDGTFFAQLAWASSSPVNFALSKEDNENSLSWLYGNVRTHTESIFDSYEPGFRVLWFADDVSSP